MEKPILFNTEMVRAILDGRKTSTRRPIKFPEGMTGHIPELQTENDIDPVLMWAGGITWPAYHVDDILWVRETWCDVYDIKDMNRPPRNIKDCDTFYYKADCASDVADNCVRKWRPSIHMPREAARLFLKVTGLKVQRIQDITEEEAIKEGFYIGYQSTPTSTPAAKARQAFMWVWNKIYSDINPWVWAYEFEKLEGYNAGNMD